MKTKSIKIKRQFLFFTFLIIFTFSTLPVFSQVFHIENSSTLSTNFVQLSCYWEFFPGKFIDPTLTLDENDYNFGLVPFFDNESFENYETKKNDAELFSKTKELLNNPNVYISREINTESFLVDVPSTWNSYRLEEPYITGKGSGSYRLLVTGLDPSKTYGFHVFDLFSNAFSIFVNGEKLITVGSPSEDYTKTVPDLSMDVVYFTPNEKGEANFVLHISNLVHRNGGAWSPIKFAEEEVINSNYRQQLSYAFLCLGILLTIFLYQLFLSLSKKIDLSNLYLAFFALSILIRLIVTPISLIEFFFPNIGYALSLKLEYAALIFGPIFFSLYLSSNLKLLHKIVVKLITIIGLILGIIIFLSSAYFANRFVPIIQTYTIVTCIYFFLIMILSYIRKPNLETGLLLFAVIITIIAVIHDIAAIVNINIFLSSTNLISYAFIIFVFIQTMIIARKQEKSHKSVIRLSESLANANKSYSRFVPKEVLTLLNKNSLVQITAGDWTSKKVTLLCFDIRQFSNWAENTEPQEIFATLNKILKEISPIVREHNGFIEKYLGDSIIAIFPNNGYQAFECALKIQSTMEELRKEAKKNNEIEFYGGIGIHYGKIVFGTVGSSERLNQISVSKEIETVIKIQKLTRILDANIIASMTAFEHWVPKDSFKSKLYNEEITYQAGIPEMVFSIIEKN